jgi:hypothetical protein
MVPKFGEGDPLPLSPVCLGGEHQKAKDYVMVLQHHLKRSGWSKSQRARIKSLIRLWTFRAEGRDVEFEKNGSFGRAQGASPPTATDAVVERWRRLAPVDKATRALRKKAWRDRERARERDRWGW